MLPSWIYDRTMIVYAAPPHSFIFTAECTGTLIHIISLKTVDYSNCGIRLQPLLLINCFS